MLIPENFGAASRVRPAGTGENSAVMGFVSLNHEIIPVQNLENYIPYFS